MMKKTFIKFSMLLILLGMSVNAAWGLDIDQAKIYLASLKAQTSPESTGSGEVKLTWLDMMGDEMEDDLAIYLNTVALSNPSWISQGSTAQLVGGTLFAMDGIEMPNGEGHMFMTSFVYFLAEGLPANGSYFSHWTFTDPAISRIDTAMGNGDNIPFKSPCYKVLPDTANNGMFYRTTGGDEKFGVSMTNVVKNPNNIYAVFNKYLLGNPVATSANIEAIQDAEAHLTVTVEINGEAASLDAEDFASFSFSNNTNSEWSYNLTAALASKVVVSEQKTSITIPVTYTYKNTGAGTKNTTMTIRMAGDEPSVLNVNLSVNALDPNRPAAFWYDGETEKASGDLSNMLDVNISAYANPILKLNKPVNTALTFSGKNFTLDLNGNETQAITVSSGNVTVAYSKFGGSATSLTVNGGKAILSGGTFGSLTIEANGTVEQNGATITVAATNAGSLTTTDGVINGGLTSSKTLVLNGGTFKGDTAVIVSGGTATINRGAIEGTNCGLKVTGGEATVKKLAAIKGGTYSAQRTGGTLIVECGKFDGPLNGSVDFTSGYFKTNNYGVSTEGKNEMLVSAGVEYNEGYRYFLGTAESAVANGAGVCRVGNVSYAKLEDAIAYANNNPSVQNIVIFMTNNYTLPAGYYTLPANATIVVPMSDEQAKEINAFPPRMSFNDMDRTHPYLEPTEFRRLTIANGVNMNVYGKIEMTCTQFASNEAYTGQPYGPYGRIVMEEGSHLTLMSGSEVRAWGFMTGKGEIDARRDAIVREMFQLGDWKGALTSVKITGMMPESSPIPVGDDSDKKIFPVSQYFIQNIESPVKYHPGAVLSTSAMVSEGLKGFLAVSMTASDIKIVGVNGRDSAIFVMDNGADAENTWVRKWYDVENDIQVYEVNNSAHIGQMVLDMGELDASFLLPGFSVPVRLNSGKFDLPITCNFKIHLLSGAMDFLQNTSLLPGAEVEVDKEATVSVAMDEVEKNTYDAWVDGGKEGDAPISYTGALYVYDAANWGEYAYGNAYNPESGSNETYTAYTKVVRYSPSWNGSPTKRDEHTCPPSAAINVHGTFQTSTGFVYTSANGANIFSTNKDAGTFIFNDNAVDAGERTVYNVEGSSTYRSLTFTPAQLKNGNGEHINTSEAVAGDAYCYINDEWTTMYPDENNPCFMVKHNTNGDVFYAKPQDYVAVAATKDSKTKLISGNDDHTFSDAAGTGRLFILAGDCQWWEVEKKDNLYHCIHPNNDTYYYWQGETKDPMDTTETIPAHWEEKRFSITWKNWNDSIIQTIGAMEELVDSYSVTYGTMAEFNGNNPTREANVDSTYNFTGWKPALGPVTQDVTYTATFESQPRMYTIIFQNEGGVEIERQFLTHNEVPVCENVPTKVGHYLIWDPAISPVIGDQTYTATWEEELPTEWDVTFVNNAGGVLKSKEKVGVNEHPTCSDTIPAKENADHTLYSSNEYIYTFWGWSAVIDGAAQQFAAGEELPSPTAPTTFTAVYTEAARPYEVKFVTYNGDETNPNHVIASGSYTYGATPVAPTTEEVLAAIADENTPNYTFNNDKFTYSFAWNPQIQTVMGATNYKVTIDSVINQYTVTLKSNLSGVCTFTGAGTFDYGKEITNVAVTYDSEKYNFGGWDDGEDAVAHSAFTLTEDITLTANFSVKSLPDLEVASSQTLTEEKEVKDFILTSNGIDASGQIFGAKYLDIKGEAIFRLTPDEVVPARTWYAVASPWRVDVRTGIYANGHQLTVGSGFDLIEFNAEAYARDDNGEGNRNIWKYVDENEGYMEPGKLYMIYLASPAASIEFHKDARATLITTKTAVDVTGGSGDKANWNAIANPALYHADLGLAGTPDVLQYDNDGGYTPTSATGLVVGQPIFAQVATPQSTVAASIASSGTPAPYRRAASASVDPDNRFVVEIARNGQMNDRIIVQTAEEKENTYVIGQDLAKMGIGSKAAQIWMERYNTNLCKNTVEMENGRAEYPLSIFAPAAGEYTISAMQQRGNETLYLTRDGEAIWNLSDGDYTISLSRGTTADYGLRVSARTPQIATGCDEVIADGAEKAQKVLVKDQIFIIRGEKVYTIDGQMVK